MTEFLTCKAGGELSLQKARRLTEEEKRIMFQNVLKVSLLAHLIT